MSKVLHETKRYWVMTTDRHARFTLAKDIPNGAAVAAMLASFSLRQVETEASTMKAAGWGFGDGPALLGT